MPRLIVNYSDDVPLENALSAVFITIGRGRESNSGKQYCYATVFESGLICLSGLTKTGTDTFNIYREGTK